MAVYIRGRLHFRQHGFRDIEIAQQCIIPFERVDVEEHRTRRIRVIRNISFAARQLPDQPGVNRAEEELPLLCTLLCTLDMVEDPADLRRGEVRIDQQTSLILHFIDKALGLEVFRNGCRLTGLPNNRVVDRTSCLLVPDDSRLALVRDADTCDVTCHEARLFECLFHDGDHRAPDFFCIVLNPARFREMLREFLLRYADDLGITVKDDGAIRGRTCI